MPTTINAEIGQGDGLVLEVTITEPANAETADFAWALYTDPEDPILLLRTADLDIAAGGVGESDVLTVTVAGSATVGLRPDNYSHELKMQLPGAQPETLARGGVRVVRSAIKDDVVA